MTYPTSIDALVNDKATITLIRAIMTELGTTPSGSEATVAARLDAVDAALADGGTTADDAGQFEKQPLYAWGHSWVANDNQTVGAKIHERFASRLRMGTATARGFSGKSIETVVFNAIGGSSVWTPRTRAAQLAVCTINNISLYGATPTPMAAGYRHAWRALLATLTANAKVASNTTSFVYSAGWTSETITPTADKTATGGARWKTSTVNDYFEFTFVGPDVDVFLIAKTAGAGVVEFKEGSTVLGQLDLTAAVAQETPAIFKVRGLTSSTHTIRGTLVSGATATVDSYRIPSTAPVAGVVLGEPLVDWSDKAWSATAPQMLIDLKADLATIVAEYPTFTLVDGATDWDFATMRYDTRHPNDKGCAHLAGLCVEAAADLPWAEGLDVMGIGGTPVPAAYTPPTGPSIPSTGFDGTGTAGGGSATAPGQVTGLTGIAGSGQVALSWTAPSSGGAAITDYIIQWRTTAGPGSWTTFTDGTSTAATTTVTGLTNGTSYDFQVAAINTVGTGTYSDAVTATPAVPAFSDSFNRADADVLTGGLAWQTAGINTNSTSSSVWGIRSNQAALISTPGTVAHAFVDTGTSDVDYTVTVAAVDPIASRSGGPMIRYLNIRNYIYVGLQTTSSDGHYRLLKRYSPDTTATTTTVIGTSSTAVVTAGDVVRVLAVGPSIKVYVNGTLIISVTETAQQTNTKHGFVHNALMTATRYDDVAIA